MVTVFAGIAAGIAFALLARTIYGLLTIPGIRSERPIDGAETPLISVLIPVRNEAKRVLREGVTSILNQSYPALDIVAVDDGSTDESLSILRDLERRGGGRLRVFENASHPEGWLGKQAALQCAVSHATGEWLLFADADVLFAPHTIASAVRFAQERKLDALTLVPRVDVRGFWPAVMLPVFAWASVVAVSPAQANNPRSKACFGWGGFILVRREAHAAIGGIESYKGEILDDWAVMIRLKAARFRVMVGDGVRVLRTRMYETLRETFHGYGKNAFVGLGHSFVKLLSALLLDWLVFLLPPAYCIYGLAAGAPAHLLSWIGLAFSFATMLAYGLHRRTDPRFFVLYPLGHLAVQALAVYSAWLYTWGPGGQWKGRTVSSSSGPG